MRFTTVLCYADQWSTDIRIIEWRWSTNAVYIEKLVAVQMEGLIVDEYFGSIYD